MKDDLRAIILEHVIERVEGGVATGIQQMIDEAIEDGFMSEEEYSENELEIAYFIDDHIFECAGCGWTLPVSETGEDENGELRCAECSPNDDD